MKENFKLILLLFGDLLISGLISIGFLHGYVTLQAQMFCTPDTLLFVQGKYYSFIAIFGIFAICLYALSWRQGGKPYLTLASYKISFAFIIAAYLITGAVAEADELFHYSRVTADSIYIRNGCWQAERRYSFTQVTRVDIGYENLGKGHHAINYVVNLADGRKVNLYYSKDFARAIATVDDILVQNQVNIVGGPITRFQEYRKKGG